MISSAEQWKAVPGYEGLYMVSDTGKVVSVKNGRWRPVRFCDRKGYFGVQISKNDKKTSFGVHRLVALAFLPNPDNKPHVNHIDGNKKNNQLSNLEWVTVSENCLHSIHVLGQAKSKGEKHSQAILTEDDVYWIRAWRYHACLARSVAAAFGIKERTVYAIWQRKLWKHLPEQEIAA